MVASNYEPNWRPRDPAILDVPAAITQLVIQIASERFPELFDLFPFQPSSEAESYFGDAWAAVTIVSQRAPGTIPAVGTMKAERLQRLQAATAPFAVRSHRELHDALGSEWFSFDRFTYVGPCRDGLLSWPHIAEHIVHWLEHLVIPEILRRNEMRVLRAVPPAQAVNLGRLGAALCVLECDKTLRQGSSFALAGIGLVTCAHVLGPESQAFRPDAPTLKRPVTVVAKNDTLDLAILRVEGLEIQPLERGSADKLRQLDHLVVAGFPNYRVGDSGTIVPGLVTGFRPVSGVRRILTNAAIVAGTSGGPVLDQGSRVIGVAVTGADRMEDAHRTEDHGIIPIDALSLL